jgi:ABC-type multidrug transport system ATPase subunit
MQDDHMFADLTVLEQISISAKLRLPNNISKEEKERRIEAVISELGLSGVKNSFIGSETKRGVSGGERKRVSIGTELVTDPSLLFLDGEFPIYDPERALSLCCRTNVRVGCVQCSQCCSDASSSGEEWTRSCNDGTSTEKQHL